MINFGKSYGPEKVLVVCAHKREREREREILQVLASLIRHDHLCWS